MVEKATEGGKTKDGEETEERDAAALQEIIAVLNQLYYQGPIDRAPIIHRGVT